METLHHIEKNHVPMSFHTLIVWLQQLLAIEPIFFHLFPLLYFIEVLRCHIIIDVICGFLASTFNI